MPLRLSRVRTFGLLLAMLVSSPALATAETPQQIAEAHLKAGLKHYEQADYETARLEFLQAQAVYPRPSLLRNLALCELKTNRPLEAIHHLRAYLGDSTTTADKRENAKKNFDEAFAKTGHVAVRASQGALVFVDTHALPGATPFKDPIDVLPGKHVLEARLGERTATRDVDAPAGVTVEVALELDERVAPVASTTVPVSATTTVSDGVVAPPREAEPPFWTTRRIVGGGFVGAGLAMLGGALYFQLQNASQADRATSISASINSKSSCASGTDARCTDLRDAYDAQDRDAVLRSVFLVGGSVAVAAGVALVLWPTASSGGSPRAAATPIVGSNFAGLQLQGTLQ